MACGTQAEDDRTVLQRLRTRTADEIVRPTAPSAFLARSMVVIMNCLQIQCLLTQSEDLPERVGGATGPPRRFDDMSAAPGSHVDGLKVLWQLGRSAS